MSLLGSRGQARNLAAIVARPVSFSHRGAHILELFSQNRARQFFRARSANRDAESDHARVELVSRSIEWSLQAARAEQTALVRRLEDVTTRALVPLGNDTDGHLTRDDLDTRRLGQLEQDMRQIERRLDQLAQHIVHFEFLRTALMVRFPDFKPSDSN
jgi:hypothetical protein